MNQSHESKSMILDVKGKEIERKFIVKKLPDNIESYEKIEITQGYLEISREDNFESRLRKSVSSEGILYYKTDKKGIGISRDEDEVEISKDDFNVDWEKTQGNRLSKTRYLIPYFTSVIEVDVYKNKLSGLVIAEVEFSNEEEAEKFSIPEFFGKEVTYDNVYKNQSLVSRVIEEILSLEDDIVRYDGQHGVKVLLGKIQEKMNNVDGTIVVSVAGGSASGKTSAVASKIEAEFGEEALVLSADDYYMGAKYIKKEKDKGNIINWDQPEAVNLALLKKHIKQLKNGDIIEKPNYSFKSGEAEGTVSLAPKKIIIVEGLFVLRKDMLEESDVKAFIEIGTHGRIIRRMLRDVNRTGQKPDEIMKYFSEVVEPMNEKYIEPTKKNADLIIVNDYNPHLESERSGMNEEQIKFAGQLDTNYLREIGAEKLSTTIQIDNYYSPKERNLNDTGEALRIREEGGKTTLTYKGPQLTSAHRKRAKFEFEIDNQTKKAFLGIYGDLNKVIKKERTLYVLDGIVFSVDDVYEDVNGRDVKLGDFIEVRMKNYTEERLSLFLKSLELSMNNGIKESYFEMGK